MAEFIRKNLTMFATLVRFIQEWKRYNQSLSELSRLGDRELADIGISRSDIPRVAWNAAHPALSFRTESVRNRPPRRGRFRFCAYGCRMPRRA